MAWLTGWNYRKKLTLDSSKIDSDCSDFPLKVILDKDNFDFSKARSDGYDIRFTSADGETLLKHEREIHKVYKNPDGLLFDGVNDAVDCGDVSAIDSASALTVECRFIYMGTGGVWGALVSKFNSSYQGFALQIHPTVFYPRVIGLGNSGETTDATTILNIGQEYHVAAVWTGSAFQIFVDGVMENEVAQTNSQIDTGTEKLWIGKRNWSSLFTPGIIKEVRVWTVAKTESQINASKAYGAITGSEDDLECLYLFDEGSGTTLTDSANSNNGTVSGATWTTLPGYGVYHVKIPTASSTSDTEFYCYYGKSDATDGADGENVWDSNYAMVHHMGSSLLDSTSNDNDGTNSGTTLGIAGDGYYRSFDGTNDRIYGSFAGDWSSINTATIEGYVVLQDKATNAHRIARINTAFTVGVNDADYKLGGYINDGTWYGSWNWGSALSMATTYHLAFTYDGTAIDAFYNGASGGSYSKSIASFDSSTDFDIGGDSGNLHPLKGNVYEVRISSTARSDAWIKATHASLADTLLTYGAETARPRVMVVWA